MTIFDKIINAASIFDVSVNVNNNELTIVNLNNGNNLLVHFDEYVSEQMTDCFIRYTVYFSTQHADFDVDYENEDKVTKWLVEYIISILNDEILPLEIYKNEKNDLAVK